MSAIRHEVLRVRPSVSHERLDDEVIAIDLESGAYYALDDVAADCWSVIADGGSVDDVVSGIVAQYDVATDAARNDVERFLAELLAERLLEPGDGEAPPAPQPAIVDARRAYRAPAIEKFEDLQDLLLLDPIHEVDEAGWPVAPAD